MQHSPPARIVWRLPPHEEEEEEETGLRIVTEPLGDGSVSYLDIEHRAEDLLVWRHVGMRMDNIAFSVPLWYAMPTYGPADGKVARLPELPLESIAALYATADAGLTQEGHALSAVPREQP